eukprot:g11980.t1
MSFNPPPPKKLQHSVAEDMAESILASPGIRPDPMMENDSSSSCKPSRSMTSSLENQMSNLKIGQADDADAGSRATKNPSGPSPAGPGMGGPGPERSGPGGAGGGPSSSSSGGTDVGPPDQAMDRDSRDRRGMDGPGGGPYVGAQSMPSSQPPSSSQGAPSASVQQNGMRGYEKEYERERSRSREPQGMGGMSIQDIEDEDSDNAALFVGDLPRNATEQALEKFFSQVGDVVHVDIKRDKITHNNLGYGFVEYAITHNNLGYGFVEYATRAQAERAQQELNGRVLGGRKIRLGWAQKNTTLFIGDLDGNTSTEELQAAFRKFGPLVEEETFVKAGSGKYGFVRFRHRQDAELSKASMNRTVIGTRIIRIGWGDNNIQKHCVHIQFNPQFAGTLTENEVKEHFQRYGEVESVRLPRFSSNRLKGYGFVHYMPNSQGEKAAGRVIASVSETKIGQCVFRCSYGKRQIYNRYRRNENRGGDELGMGGMGRVGGSNRMMMGRGMDNYGRIRGGGGGGGGGGMGRGVGRGQGGGSNDVSPALGPQVPPMGMGMGAGLSAAHNRFWPQNMQWTPQMSPMTGYQPEPNTMPPNMPLVDMGNGNGPNFQDGPGGPQNARNRGGQQGRDSVAQQQTSPAFYGRPMPPESPNLSALAGGYIPIPELYYPPGPNYQTPPQMGQGGGAQASVASPYPPSRAMYASLSPQGQIVYQSMVIGDGIPMLPLPPQLDPNAYLQQQQPKVRTASFMEPGEPHNSSFTNSSSQSYSLSAGTASSASSAVSSSSASTSSSSSIPTTRTSSQSNC